MPLIIQYLSSGSPIYYYNFSKNEYCRILNKMSYIYHLKYNVPMYEWKLKTNLKLYFSNNVFINFPIIYEKVL